MKHNKAFFLLMILFLLLGSIQVDAIFAQEGDQVDFMIERDFDQPEPEQVDYFFAQEGDQFIAELSQQRSLDDAPSFGMNFHPHAFNSVPLGKAKAANNHWVRYNGLEWSKVQPEQLGDFNWEYGGNPNQYLENASIAGMEVILIIRSTPTWAQKNPPASCGPMKEANIPDFADFMNKVVARYSEPPFNVKYYEIWNEPDDSLVLDKPDSQYGCWGDPTDDFFGGGYYGEVLKAVYPKVKAASIGEAQVVLGGLLLPIDPDNTTIKGGDGWLYAKQTKFFEGVLIKCGNDPCFDIVNFHGFTMYRSDFPSAIRMEKADPVNNHWWMARGGQVEGKLAFLKEIMLKYNINKPIILTEAGLPLTGSDNVAWPTWSPDKQARFQSLKADYVTYLYTRNIAVGIDVTTWYHFLHGWNRTGLLDWKDGYRYSEEEAFHAYKGVTTALAGADFVRRLNTCGGLLGFEFQRPDESYLWVLFSEEGAKTIQLTQGYKVFDHNFDPLLPQPGIFTFSRPTYIEFASSAPILPYCTFLPLLNR